MRSQKLILLCFTVAAISLSCNRKKSDNSSQTPDIQVAEAVTDSLTLYKTYPGIISANSTVNVVGRVNGTVLTSNFSGGDLVQKGQVLLNIEKIKIIP